ncbi:MAG TPA: DegT/DnrJ/EryC1/StrS family aminotransferase, partial [Candidatus Marinimicrobia bacterium]|nr:DegT/DnrJ/EryC1/StrS family aminotransferase [Candidatus Neomarinimicrobiota bacterium]
NELRQYLADNEIGSEIYYPVPFHLQECFKYLGYNCGDFPHSEYTAAHSLALPIYPELMEDMQAYVVEKVLKFY